jgi:phospholipid/cholesterol/gamma-HCH transport system substrate-binding protein
MANERTEILAGAAVLAVAVAFALYAANAAGLSRDPGSYELRASFRAVDGISVGSDVRLAGLKVGTITDLRLNPETFFADATIALRREVVLPEDSAILISSEGLLGGNYVEIIPGGALETLSAGDEILDTQGSVSLVSLLMKFVASSAGEAEAAE